MATHNTSKNMARIVRQENQYRKEFQYLRNIHLEEST